MVVGDRHPAHQHAAGDRGEPGHEPGGAGRVLADRAEDHPVVAAVVGDGGDDADLVHRSSGGSVL